jgi:hypothetical protein
MRSSMQSNEKAPDRVSNHVTRVCKEMQYAFATNIHGFKMALRLADWREAADLSPRFPTQLGRVATIISGPTTDLGDTSEN